MNRTGWLVNDCLTCIPGTNTFWHNLLEWVPLLVDKTRGYTDYSILADVIEMDVAQSTYIEKPYYIIRNGSYFRGINVQNIKTISLIQDILQNNMQLDVINRSDIVVFNTYYVFNKYKNKITATTIKICPLGIDFNFFKPIVDRHPDIPSNSIIFIGSSTNYPKGFSIMLDIIYKTDYHFCLIMKDNFSIDHFPSHIKSRVRVFNSVNQYMVRLLINSCMIAVCTSYEETQHLAGIECGACNIPIVAREIGFYYDCRNDTDWGLIADDTTFIEKIKYVMDHRSEFNPRDYLIQKYSLEICRKNWIDIIESM
jgi:glycosyltransferase involved in cell wall biosynthesis